MNKVDPNLAPLEQQLLESLLHAKATNNLVVALSGGIDSKVLLSALVNLRDAQLISDLSAIHINHGLQSTSDIWQQNCQADCDQYQVPLSCHELHLGVQPQKNLEAMARDGRYKVFEATLQSGQWLLMAHHQDDQAETLLFRLLRGSGIAGAGAMPQSRPLGAGKLLRPLLELDRAAIEEYAAERGLSWIDDPSNASEAFSRNFIRHRVMPIIRQKWPGATATLSRFSQLARQQGELLAELAREDMDNTIDKHLHLSANKVAQLSPARQKNLFHYWATHVSGLSPTSNEIKQLVLQLAAAVKGATIKIDFGVGLVRSYSGQLILTAKAEPDSSFNQEYWQDVNQPLTLSNGVVLRTKITQHVGLRLPKENETVLVKPRSGGEKCLPDYRGKSTSLKKAFQELAVPPWQREWLPVIYFNDRIVAVPGVFIDKDFLSEAGEPSLKISLVANNN